MKDSSLFSGSGIIGKVVSGLFSHRNTFHIPHESETNSKFFLLLDTIQKLVTIKIAYIRIPVIWKGKISYTRFKSLSFTILVIFLFLNSSACNQSSGNEADSNNNLLIGLVAGQTQLRDSLISINGYWEDNFYLSGVITKAGNFIVSTNLSGTGTWSTTSSTSNDRVNRIVEYDNAARVLYFQQGQGNNNNFTSSGFPDYREKFGKIVWTLPSATGCESSATQCFYYCESVFGKSSLSAAKSDTTQVNSTNPGSSGCNGSSWSRALSRQGNPNW